MADLFPESGGTNGPSSEDPAQDVAIASLQSQISSSANLGPLTSRVSALETFNSSTLPSTYLTISDATSTYLTQSNAASTYETQANLASTLSGYTTLSYTDAHYYPLSSNPANYVDTSTLTGTLGSYVLSSSLTGTLANYVLSSSLSSTLAGYAPLNTSSLTNYYTKSQIDSTVSTLATTSSLSSYLTISAYNANTPGYITNSTSSLANYNTTSAQSTIDSAQNAAISSNTGSITALSSTVSNLITTVSGLNALAIPTSPITGITGTNVQAMLASLQTNINNITVSSSGLDPYIVSQLTPMLTAYLGNPLFVGSSQKWYNLNQINQPLGTGNNVIFTKLTSSSASSGAEGLRVVDPSYMNYPSLQVFNNGQMFLNSGGVQTLSLDTNGDMNIKGYVTAGTSITATLGVTAGSTLTGHDLNITNGATIGGLASLNGTTIVGGAFIANNTSTFNNTVLMSAAPGGGNSVLVVNRADNTLSPLITVSQNGSPKTTLWSDGLLNGTYINLDVTTTPYTFQSKYNGTSVVGIDQLGSFHIADYAGRGLMYDIDTTNGLVIHGNAAFSTNGTRVISVLSPNDVEQRFDVYNDGHFACYGSARPNPSFASFVVGNNGVVTTSNTMIMNDWSSSPHLVMAAVNQTTSTNVFLLDNTGRVDLDQAFTRNVWSNLGVFGSTGTSTSSQRYATYTNGLLYGQTFGDGSYQILNGSSNPVIDLSASTGLTLHGYGFGGTLGNVALQINAPNDGADAINFRNDGTINCYGSTRPLSLQPSFNVTNTGIINSNGMVQNTVYLTLANNPAFSHIKIGGSTVTNIYPQVGDVVMGYFTSNDNVVANPTTNPSVIIGYGSQSVSNNSSFVGKKGADTIIGYSCSGPITGNDTGSGTRYDCLRTIIGNSNVVFGYKSTVVGSGNEFTSAGIWNYATSGANISLAVLGQSWGDSAFGAGVVHSYVCLGSYGNPQATGVVLGSTPPVKNGSAAPLYISTNVSGGLTNNEICYQSSSVKTKDNIVDYVVPVKDFMALKPRSYILKSTGTSDFGLIGEELDTISSCNNPVVHGNDNEVITIDYSKLVVPLISMVQQQQKHINALTAAIQTLIPGFTI